MASLPAGRRGILSAYLWRMFFWRADASRAVTTTDVCYNKTLCRSVSVAIAVLAQPEHFFSNIAKKQR